jgi:hypothetical protein
MKKGFLLASVLIFISGCQLGDNSAKDYSKVSDVPNPYAKKVAGGVIYPSDLTLLKDFDSGKFDTIKYENTLRLKSETLVNTIRNLPLQCNDNKASSGKANCIVYNSALESIAKKSNKEIADVDDITYSTKSIKQLASISGYKGGSVKKASLSFNFDSNNKDRILTKILEEAIRSTEGSCSIIMNKKMTNYGMAYTTKEVDGANKVYATIVLEE